MLRALSWREPRLGKGGQDTQVWGKKRMRIGEIEDEDVEALRQVWDGAERHLSLDCFPISVTPSIQIHRSVSVLPSFFLQERIFSEVLGLTSCLIFSICTLCIFKPCKCLEPYFPPRKLRS